MRNVFIQDLKNIKSEVLALKQSYIRGLDRINLFVGSATHQFTTPIAQYQYHVRITIEFLTNSTQEPFNMLNSSARIIDVAGRLWDSNLKRLIVAGTIIVPDSMNPYTQYVIASAQILNVSIEEW